MIPKKTANDAIPSVIAIPPTQPLSILAVGSVILAMKLTITITITKNEGDGIAQALHMMIDFRFGLRPPILCRLVAWIRPVGSKNRSSGAQAGARQVRDVIQSRHAPDDQRRRLSGLGPTAYSASGID